MKEKIRGYFGVGIENSSKKMNNSEAAKKEIEKMIKSKLKKGYKKK